MQYKIIRETNSVDFERKVQAFMDEVDEVEHMSFNIALSGTNTVYVGHIGYNRKLHVE